MHWPDTVVWNPWHGCHKYSEGCAHCYMYRRDESVGQDPTVVRRTRDFDKILRRDRDGDFKVKPGTLVYLCMTSDFFVEDADAWRPEIWEMIRRRPDLDIMIITKRILRFSDCVPADWGTGWPQVAVTCTVENQRQYNVRYPVFRDLPIAHKWLTSEPLLGPVTMTGLNAGIEGLVVGGESGTRARLCRYDWVLDLRRQCVVAGVPFYFKQTGARFEKDGRIYRIPRRLQHEQARKAGIDTEK
ncbi:MAG: DUF5131 family protein [Eubacteriaceae bacterium]|nr:DUF5131 family protein [Eubacteriaceae bacterium]MDD4508702.1 DUF5131 family protein [Eubacteriaceae bacterium]